MNLFCNLLYLTMKIAIVHFHLKTGGVTSVIHAQVQSIQKRGHDVLVISGQEPEKQEACETAVVPGLAYDAHRTPQSPRSVADAVLAAVAATWPLGADILHVHNPTLAKNRDLQSILKLLQKAGVRLLCQIHDFAEDGRPTAYFKEEYVPDCHYAALNRRDCERLRLAGLDARGVHFLPNPVAGRPIHPTGKSGKGAVVYPVRAIRRKNIGEAILLSMFWKDIPLWITLPPNSAVDFDHYNRWRWFVEKWKLPVVFDVGLKNDFADIMHQARSVLTASITEGFGFTFLEPWMHGKALWGRKLSDICKDFTENGIRLDHLYNQLRVPLDAVDSGEAAAMWQQAFARAGRLLGIPLDEKACRNAWNRITPGNQIDFGLLNETLQHQALVSVLKSEELRTALKTVNPFLEACPPHVDPEIVMRNQDAVRHAYHLDRYAERLMTVYRSTIDTRVRHGIDKNRLAQSFLAPQTFSLLKWGSCRDENRDG